MVADGLDVLELQGAALPQGGQLVDVQPPEQLVAALHRRHVGGGEGEAEPGGGDALVERFGELLDGQQPALDLGRAAAPHVHGLLGPAAHPGARPSQQVGRDQAGHQGGVGALAINEADLATRHAREVGEPLEGDRLARARRSHDGHGLAAQVGRRDDVTALAPAGQVAVQRDPERRRGQPVVARLGEQPGRAAVAAALVDALAPADERAPLGPASGPLGVPHRQRGGQQPHRDGQPHLRGHQVAEELADRDPGPWRAEAKVQGHVLPEVLGHQDVPAQGLLGASHREHHADAGEAGQGEAPPVPTALQQDDRLPSQPGDDGQGGEPDQQEHDQQQAVGGGLAGGPGDGLAGGGLPAVAWRRTVRAGHGAPPGRR